MSHTVEEHLEGLRAAGERVPSRFVRAGLLYDLEKDPSGSWVYQYEPVEGFQVDGITYPPVDEVRSPGVMLTLQRDGGGMSRMDHTRPPTDEQLDRWVHGYGGGCYLDDTTDPNTPT